MADLFAGQIPTAAELEDAVQVGEMVLDVSATTDSSVWTNATKVITNLSGTFSAVAGAKYRADCRAAVTHDTTGRYVMLAIYIKNGGIPANTDTQISATGEYIEAAAVVRNADHFGTFTTASSATYGVAVFGWTLSGSSGNGKLHGATTDFINRLTVTRVG